MQKETKKYSTSSIQICQNCKNDFVIDSDDFGFYEKIKVPPPTFCPECRLMRRLVWRNERSLFRKKNSAEGKDNEIITVYHPDSKMKVYDRDTWWGDKWNPLDYGIDYDFFRSFFEQFNELMEHVPHLSLSDSKSVNSRFCNITVEMKNCYMIFAGWTSEDCMYVNRLSHCKYVHDSYIIFNTEFGYENVYCRDSNRLFFSLESESCVDSYFLYDCRNCSDCILCTNLRNKNYCIENIQYTREEYIQKKNELKLDTRTGIKNASIKFKKLWENAFHRHVKLTNTVNVTGDHVVNSRNCTDVFDSMGDFENVKYANWGSKGLKDAWDVGPGCGGRSEIIYDGISIGVSDTNVFFSCIIWYCSNIYYSYMLNNCHNCFGCAELNGKQYCILNKQYTKEEYEMLVPRIIEQMKQLVYVDKKGRSYSFGEFFPAELSPFAYNETVAQDYFPSTKDKEDSWREAVKNLYQSTIEGKNLPESIKEIDDSILNETIKCEITGRPFRIVEQELTFYRKLNLPLPSIHPDERHNIRLQQRNPLTLRKRICYLCDKEVDTTYLSEEEGGPKKVLCTEHYNKEIY